MTTPRNPLFTPADADRAYDEWGCNCGPSAIAAICNLTLDEVRPHMGDFETKHYANPTLMLDTLNRLYFAKLLRAWTRAQATWPQYGLVRIQWEGPWTKPGVPARARYRHTHWVGAGRHRGRIGIFDINAMSNGSGWTALENWECVMVPYILKECVPKADGKWHITHAIEVTPAEIVRTAATTIPESEQTDEEHLEETFRAAERSHAELMEPYSTRLADAESAEDRVAIMRDGLRKTILQRYPSAEPAAVPARPKQEAML